MEPKQKLYRNRGGIALWWAHLKSNDVYKPWIAYAMYWPVKGFEATGQPYWYSSEGGILQSFNIIFQGQNGMYYSNIITL